MSLITIDVQSAEHYARVQERFNELFADWPDAVMETLTGSASTVPAAAQVSVTNLAQPELEARFKDLMDA